MNFSIWKKLPYIKKLIYVYSISIIGIYVLSIFGNISSNLMTARELDYKPFACWAFDVYDECGLKEYIKNVFVVGPIFDYFIGFGNFIYPSDFVNQLKNWHNLKHLDIIHAFVILLITLFCWFVLISLIYTLYYYIKNNHHSAKH